MKLLIFITTSNGIFVLDDVAKSSQLILSNKHTPGLFNKKARGYFGICFHEETGKIIVASRERLTVIKHNKPTTDTKLHAIDPISLRCEQIATIRDIHDVHQIACHQHFVYLTDTGKNRIVVYDLNRKEVVKNLNLGSVRDDIHHVNALLIENDSLLIGLNNRGSESQILTIELKKIHESNTLEQDAMDQASIQAISKISHSHDIERCDQKLLCCSSKDGWVVDTATSEILIKAENWLRGITGTRDYIWVGASHFADRKSRHEKAHEGMIFKYRLQDHQLIETYLIQGSGQVNDLINHIID